MTRATDTVIVTGAAGGIGRAVAKRLLGDGKNVALIDMDPRVAEVAATLFEGHGKAHGIAADITDTEAVAGLVSEVRNRFGPIDGLVNNAGIVDNIAPLEKMAQSAWEREIAVNLTGAFNLIRAVVPEMRERRYGRIVNVSSAAARGGLIRQAGYSASKAGLLGLSRAVTLEYARYGVCCNCILPGVTATEKVNAMPQEIKDAATAMTPAGRFGDVEEAADLVAFLLKPEAGFINGAEIDISGGAHLNVTSLGSRKEVARSGRA